MLEINVLNHSYWLAVNDILFFFFFFFQTMDLQSRSGFHIRRNASNNLWIYVAHHFVPWTLKGKKVASDWTNPLSLTIKWTNQICHNKFIQELGLVASCLCWSTTKLLSKPAGGKLKPCCPPRKGISGTFVLFWKWIRPVPLKLFHWLF